MEIFDDLNILFFFNDAVMLPQRHLETKFTFLSTAKLCAYTSLSCLSHSDDILQKCFRSLLAKVQDYPTQLIILYTRIRLCMYSVDSFRDTSLLIR